VAAILIWDSAAQKIIDCTVTWNFFLSLVFFPNILKLLSAAVVSWWKTGGSLRRRNGTKQMVLAY